MYMYSIVSVGAMHFIRQVRSLLRLINQQSITYDVRSCIVVGFERRTTGPVDKRATQQSNLGMHGSEHPIAFL